MIKIYDGNNYARRIFEKDATGLAQRNMFQSMLFETDPTIWVWDGKQGNKRRRDKYPAYKMNRQAKDPSLFEKFKLLQETLAHTPVVQVTVPGWEADDVVATLVRRYAGPATPVSVFSNDYDFFQLAEEYPDRVFVGAKPKDHVPHGFVRTYKCCVGDVSDNISGIKGFGEKSWASADKALLKAFLSGSSEYYPFKSEHVKVWCDENKDTLRAMWDIVGLYNVPISDIDAHMFRGSKSYDKGNALLERYFL